MSPDVSLPLLSLCRFLSLSIYLSLPLPPLSLSRSPSCSCSLCLSLFLCLSVCLSLSLSQCLSVSLSVSVSVCLSLCLSVCLSLPLSSAMVVYSWPFAADLPRSCFAVLCNLIFRHLLPILSSSVLAYILPFSTYVSHFPA